MTTLSFAVLLLFTLLSWIRADASQLPRSVEAACGSDRVSYLESSYGFCGFVNGEQVDEIAFCEVLRRCPFSYDSSRGIEWRRIREARCCRGLSGSCLTESNSSTVAFLRVATRKLLLQIPKNSSVYVKLNKDTPHSDLSSTEKKMAVAFPAAFLFCCALLCPCFRSKRKESKDTSAQTDLEMINNSAASPYNGRATPELKTWNPQRAPPSPLRVPPSPSRFVMSPHLKRVGSLHLNMNQIIKATRNFSDVYVIGEGGFGKVYKAELADGQIVAIKRARKEQIHALRSEFSSEVELLSKIEHRNLVRLLGYINKESEAIIISEYVPNGTVREHLDGQHGKILDFNQRLEISIDVAHALTYLHLFAGNPVIHRDVKSSNILLTESFRAKVSDFGFARTGATGEDESHVLTKVKGTAGYLDPEYLRTHQLTPKSDVFSYGILLLEILSGRRPVELKREINERITVRWAFKKYTHGKMRDILDPLIEEVIHGEVLRRMFALAFECAAPTRADRPTMNQVVETLWEIRREYWRNPRRE